MGGTMTASQVDAQVHYHSVIAKSTKGFSHAASNPNPTCRVGGRKMKDSTAVGSKVPAVGLHCYRNYVPAVATFKVQLDRYV